MYLVLVLLMRSGRRTYYTPATTLDEDVVPEKRKSKEEKQREKFLALEKDQKVNKKYGLHVPIQCCLSWVKKGQ